MAIPNILLKNYPKKFTRFIFSEPSEESEHFQPPRMKTLFLNMTGNVHFLH
jgi:hypothetical protein